MKHRIPMSYAVPRAVVLRVMTEPDFHAEKIRRLQPLSIEHGKLGSPFSIRVRRTMRNKGPVPTLRKKRVREIHPPVRAIQIELDSLSESVP